MPPYDYLQAWQGHRNPFAAIPTEPPPVAGAQLESTDISAASGLDTAAVLAVASGAAVDSGPRGARRPGPDGAGAAGRGAGSLMTPADSPRTCSSEERAPAYRSRQLTHAVYAELAERWDEVTALPRPLRERLERDAPLRTLSEEDAQRAEDGTIKLQLRTHDGYPLEAVAMSHGPRRTVCLSSQSGCALACTFCATGRMGLGRNLLPEEISEQLLRLARLLRDEQDARISNVVMMGMGEPFHNYDNVLAAIRTINAPDAFGLGARQIAISTAGWIPGIDKLAEEPLQVKLALSLHAPDDELRSKLMPVTKRYPIAELMEACRGTASAPAARLHRVPAARGRQRQLPAGAAAGRAAAARRPGRVPRQPDRLQPDRLGVRRCRRRLRAALPRRAGARRHRHVLPRLARPRHRGGLRAARDAGHPGAQARKRLRPPPG